MPRTQRNINEKIQIIKYYNSIKTIPGAKNKTIKHFKLSGFF